MIALSGEWREEQLERSLEEHIEHIDEAEVESTYTIIINYY